MFPWLIEFFFSQLLRFCKLPEYSFSILRNTFAYRVIECGTEPNVLRRILDDPYEEKNYEYFYSIFKKGWH